MSGNFLPAAAHSQESPADGVEGQGMADLDKPNILVIWGSSRRR